MSSGKVGAALMKALESFIQANTSFESSTGFQVLKDDLVKCSSVADMSMVPLRRMIFGFDAALKWGAFLYAALPPLLKKHKNSIHPSFSLEKYTDKVIKLYDIAVGSELLDHCESDDESE